MELPKVERAAFQTSYEMLEDRGYTVTDAIVAADGVFFWRIHGRCESRGTTVVVCVISPSRQTAVTVAQENISYDKLIVVGQKVAATTRTALAREGIEVFSVAEMVINPVRLRIAPVYRVLLEEEKEELFKRRSITADCLPLIQATDKAVRYLGLTSGTVIRTTSKFTGIVSYQIVKHVVPSESYKAVRGVKVEPEADGLLTALMGEEDQGGDEDEPLSEDEERNNDDLQRDDDQVSDDDNPGEGYDSEQGEGDYDVDSDND